MFRTPEGFRALDHACPHAGGPLADGIVADRCVTCPLHGWRFELDTGEARNADARVRTYEVTVEPAEPSAIEPLAAETYPVTVEADRIVLHL